MRAYERFSMKITAAVVDHKGGDFEIRNDIDLADMGPQDLLVKIVASGICHSDEAIRKGDAVIGYPVILGHEGSGIVQKVGSEVHEFKPGDHVVMSFSACGHCINCLRGIPTRCLNYAKINLSGVGQDGKPQFTENGKPICNMFNQSSFATYTVVRERNCVKVDKSLDLRKLGPLGCGYVTGSGTVFNSLQPHPGSTIAVVGTGAVGLAAMMAGVISGCSVVAGVDINDDRLKLAKELGATDIVNSAKNDMVQALKNLTGGHGFDYIVDTTGVTKVMENCVNSLAQGGTLAAIAVTPHHMDVDTWNGLSTSDRKIIGVNMGDAIPQVDVPRLIGYYKRGMFDFDKTEKFYDFKDINKANADSVSGKTIKPVLVIDPDYKPGD